MKKFIILIIVLSSTALAQRPSVTTKQLTVILENIATLNGSVTTLPSLPISEVGFVWSKSESPTRTRNEGSVLLDEGSTNYSEPITDLEPDTRYFVRMFAYNEKGISYGKNIVFETLSFNVARSIDKVRLAEADLATIDTDGDGVVNQFEDDAPNDGDPEDYDGLTNGQIHDPGGPAFLLHSSNIPVFNNYSRALIILSLLAIGFVIIRFRNN